MKTKTPIPQLRQELKERSERMELKRDAVIDAVSAFVPLSAPAVPAALTWVAIIEHYPDLLHIPVWAALIIGLIAALAVESLGVLSIETALSMWQWNQSAADDDRAPLWLAVAAAVIYLITVVLLVVLLKMFPEWALGSLLPLSTLGVIASVIAVSRKQHSERLYRHDMALATADKTTDMTQEIDRLRVQLRDKDNQAAAMTQQLRDKDSQISAMTRRLTLDTTPATHQAPDTGQEEDQPSDTKRLTPDKRRDSLLAMLGQGYDTPEDIDVDSLADTHGVSGRTIRRDLDALSASGRLALNGHVTVSP